MTFGTAAKIITKDGREVDDGDLFFMKEKRGVLSAVGEPDWEKVTLTVDSGASDTVVPPTVCRAAKLVKGDKFGIEYEIADGETIERAALPYAHVRRRG